MSSAGRSCGFCPRTAWLTGLPCSGKSTIALGVRARFREAGQPLRVLDGDVVRQGLCRDLDFTPEGRAENIRRVAEVARLFNDTGIAVVTALISPLATDRALARAIIGPEHFL